MARARVLLLACAVLAVAVIVPSRPSVPARAEGTLEKVGEFRPFPADNKLGSTSFLNVLDAARRTWFFVTYTDPVTGATVPPRVWTFAMDPPAMRGSHLQLVGATPNPIVGALEPGRGLLLLVYGTSGALRLGAIAAADSGPKVAAEWALQPRLASESGVATLQPAGLVFAGGKGYLALEAPAVKETHVLQFDLGRLLAGQDPFDWRYRVRQCPALPHYNVSTAVGKSGHEPVLSLPCRAQPGSSDLQGVAVVELGSFTPSSTAGFVDRFYPIAGDFGNGESYYDPTSDRLAMRRVGPAQLVVFDVRHRRWMRPILFGQSNMEQSVLDETTGRIYGDGDDPGDGGNKEFLYVPELRPTPPQNGLTVLHNTPSPGSTLVGKGRMAVDTKERLLYVADLKPPPGSTSPVGLYFHVYRDSRPALTESRAFDPDEDIANLSAESQAYGARVSYVGGIGATFSNAFSATYPAGGVVAQGTRHAAFARALRARLTEGESSAEAIVSHPEGATDSELKNTSDRTGQDWPHESTGCRDFGRAPGTARDPSGGAEVVCDLDYPRTAGTAVYEAGTRDPHSAPVQRAAVRVEISIHATKGVVTTVTAEGSLDIPGIVSIGRMRATAITSAAGKKGTATSSYRREMQDVSIAGQPFCSSDCDPNDVAAEINSRFAAMGATGTQVVATVPRPDPTLLASPGGVQAIVQRDLWDHEEDVAIHDGADDKFELPAFVIAIYQDRRFPQHEVYSLAGVQAVSRLPRSLAEKLDELASPDPDPPSTAFSPDLPDGSPVSPADFDLPIGPAGSSLSAPISGRRSRSSGPGSLRFSERMAWALASPLRSPAMLAVLSFLAVPVYLSSRRRVLLVHRPAQAGDTDAD